MKLTIASLSLIISSASAVCTEGQYDDNGSCTPCSAGTYSNTTTATSCATCPTGTYSLSEASSCVDCSTGTTQYDLSTGNVNAASCNTGCQAGYSYSSTASACAICDAGTYTANVTESNNLWSSHACTSCPTGYWTDGVNPSSSCVEMCAANYENTDGECTACRTGTTSSAALISAATCVCSDDANGCYGHGTCTNAVCVCESGWTGTFCNSFDNSVVETAETTVEMSVATDTAWSADFEDPTSDAYVNLKTSVEDAAIATFEASAQDGYVLKSATATLSQDTSTSRRKRRNTGNVVAKTALVIEHAATDSSGQTVTADSINTFVAAEVAASNAFTAAGMTADTTSIAVTDSTDSSVAGGLTDGQIIGIVIGVCGSVLLAFILFMIFAK